MQNLEYLKKTNNFIESYLSSHSDIQTRFIVIYPDAGMFEICIYNEGDQSIVCSNCYDKIDIYKDPIKDEININIDKILDTTESPIEIEIPDKLKGKVVLIDSFNSSTIDEHIRSIKIYMDRNLVRIWANPGAPTSFTLNLLVFEKVE